MSKTPREEKNEGPNIQPVRRGQGFWMVGIVLLAVFLMLFLLPGLSSKIDYSFFLEQLEKENIQELTVYDSYIQGEFKVAPEKPLPSNYKVKEGQEAPREKLN
jgi:hypothetical protein